RSRSRVVGWDRVGACAAGPPLYLIRRPRGNLFDGARFSPAPGARKGFVAPGRRFPAPKLVAAYRLVKRLTVLFPVAAPPCPRFIPGSRFFRRGRPVARFPEGDDADRYPEGLVAACTGIGQVGEAGPAALVVAAAGRLSQGGGAVAQLLGAVHPGVHALALG